jgi:hypothetical protein
MNASTFVSLRRSLLIRSTALAVLVSLLSTTSGVMSASPAVSTFTGSIDVEIPEFNPRVGVPFSVVSMTNTLSPTATITYQWYTFVVETEAEAPATGVGNNTDTYTPVTEDVGKLLYVLVTGSALGYSNFTEYGFDSEAVLPLASAPTVTANDVTNTIVGLDTDTMEFSIDGGGTWSVVVPDLNGDASVGVRFKAVGLGAPSDAVFLVFHLFPAPIITDIYPATVSPAGGTTFSIYGNEFVNGAVVSIAGTDLVTQFLSSTHLYATTVSRGGGVGSGRVTNPDTQFADLYVPYIAQDMPAILDITQDATTLVLTLSTTSGSLDDLTPDTNGLVAGVIFHQRYGVDYLATATTTEGKVVLTYPIQVKLLNTSTRTPTGAFVSLPYGYYFASTVNSDDSRTSFGKNFNYNRRPLPTVYSALQDGTTGNLTLSAAADASLDGVDEKGTTNGKVNAVIFLNELDSEAYIVSSETSLTVDGDVVLNFPLQVRVLNNYLVATGNVIGLPGNRRYYVLTAHLPDLRISEYNFETDPLSFLYHGITPIKPDVPAVTADDTANTITGLDLGTMEYSLDGGETWLQLEDPVLTGNITVKVRVVSDGFNGASDPTTLTFTSVSPSGGGYRPVVPSIATATTTTPITLEINAIFGGTLTALIPGVSGATTLTVVAPPGATTENFTLSLLLASNGTDTTSGHAVIKLSAVTTTGGTAVTTFEKPLAITLPAGAAGSVSAWSIDGFSWSTLPLLTSVSLPAGQTDGYFINADGTYTLFTRHLTFFGFRKAQDTHTVSSSATDIQMDKSAQVISAGGSGSGVVNYSTTTPLVCSVSSSGLVTALAAGTCTLNSQKLASGIYLDAKAAALNITVSALKALVAKNIGATKVKFTIALGMKYANKSVTLTSSAGKKLATIKLNESGAGSKTIAVNKSKVSKVDLKSGTKKLGSVKVQ